MKTRFLTGSVVAVAAVVWSAWASAQESPVQYFSQEVDILMRLREPDQTLEKLAALANTIQPGAGDAVKGQTAALGQAISNPTLTGVDQSRDWYVGVYGQQDGAPIMVFAIPAIKAEDMISALGPDVKTQVHDRWVLYTDGEEIPKSERATSLVSILSAPAQANLNTGDFSLVVNAAHLVDLYAEQLDLAQDKVLELLNSLRFLPQQSGINMQAVVDVYGTLAEGLFQAVEDAKTYSLSFSLSETGLALDQLVEFDQDSASSEFLAHQTTSNMALIEKLPAGAPLYYGFSGMSKELTRFGLKMSLSMLEDNSEAKQLDQLMSQLDGVEFGSIVASLNIADTATGMLVASGIAEVNPAEKFKEFSRSMLAALGQMKTPGFKQDTEIQKDAETYDAHKGDVVTVKQEFSEELDPTGMQARIQQMMFGEQGMQSRLVYLNDKYASTLGGGQAAMAALLSDLNSSKSNGLKKPRADLMEKVNLLVFLDLPGLVARGLKAASHVEGIPLQINAEMIDSLNLPASFISYAAAAEPNQIRIQTRVPAEQLVGMAKLVMLIASSGRPAF